MLNKHSITHILDVETQNWKLFPISRNLRLRKAIIKPNEMVFNVRQTFQSSFDRLVNSPDNVSRLQRASQDMAKFITCIVYQEEFTRIVLENLASNDTITIVKCFEEHKIKTGLFRVDSKSQCKNRRKIEDSEWIDFDLIVEIEITDPKLEGRYLLFVEYKQSLSGVRQHAKKLEDFSRSRAQVNYCYSDLSRFLEEYNVVQRFSIYEHFGSHHLMLKVLSCLTSVEQTDDKDFLLPKEVYSFPNNRFFEVGNKKIPVQDITPDECYITDLIINEEEEAPHGLRDLYIEYYALENQNMNSVGAKANFITKCNDKKQISFLDEVTIDFMEDDLEDMGPRIVAIDKSYETSGQYRYYETDFESDRELYQQFCLDSARLQRELINHEVYDSSHDRMYNHAMNRFTRWETRKKTTRFLFNLQTYIYIFEKIAYNYKRSAFLEKDIEGLEDYFVFKEKKGHYIVDKRGIYRRVYIPYAGVLAIEVCVGGKAKLDRRLHAVLHNEGKDIDLYYTPATLANTLVNLRSLLASHDSKETDRSPLTTMALYYSIRMNLRYNYSFEVLYYVMKRSTSKIYTNKYWSGTFLFCKDRFTCLLRYAIIYYWNNHVDLGCDHVTSTLFADTTLVSPTCFINQMEMIKYCYKNMHSYDDYSSVFETISEIKDNYETNKSRSVFSSADVTTEKSGMACPAYSEKVAKDFSKDYTKVEELESVVHNILNRKISTYATSKGTSEKEQKLYLHIMSVISEYGDAVTVKGYLEIFEDGYISVFMKNQVGPDRQIFIIDFARRLKFSILEALSDHILRDIPEEYQVNTRNRDKYKDLASISSCDYNQSICNSDKSKFSVGASMDQIMILFKSFGSSKLTSTVSNILSSVENKKFVITLLQYKSLSDELKEKWGLVSDLPYDESRRIFRTSKHGEASYAYFETTNDFMMGCLGKTFGLWHALCANFVCNEAIAVGLVKRVDKQIYSDDSILKPTHNECGNLLRSKKRFYSFYFTKMFFLGFAENLKKLSITNYGEFCSDFALNGQNVICLHKINKSILTQDLSGDYLSLKNHWYQKMVNKSIEYDLNIKHYMSLNVIINGLIIKTFFPRDVLVERFEETIGLDLLKEGLFCDVPVVYKALGIFCYTSIDELEIPRKIKYGFERKKLLVSTDMEPMRLYDIKYAAYSDENIDAVNVLNNYNRLYSSFIVKKAQWDNCFCETRNKYLGPSTYQEHLESDKRKIPLELYSKEFDEVLMFINNDTLDSMREAFGLEHNHIKGLLRNKIRVFPNQLGKNEPTFVDFENSLDLSRNAVIDVYEVFCHLMKNVGLKDMSLFSSRGAPRNNIYAIINAINLNTDSVFDIDIKNDETLLSLRKVMRASEYYSKVEPKLVRKFLLNLQGVRENAFYEDDSQIIRRTDGNAIYYYNKYEMKNYRKFGIFCQKSPEQYTFEVNLDRDSKTLLCNEVEVRLEVTQFNCTIYYKNRLKNYAKLDAIMNSALLLMSKTNTFCMFNDGNAIIYSRNVYCFEDLTTHTFNIDRVLVTNKLSFNLKYISLFNDQQDLQKIAHRSQIPIGDVLVARFTEYANLYLHKRKYPMYQDKQMNRDIVTNLLRDVDLTRQPDGRLLTENRISDLSHQIEDNISIKSTGFKVNSNITINFTTIDSESMGSFEDSLRFAEPLKHEEHKDFADTFGDGFGDTFSTMATNIYSQAISGNFTTNYNEYGTESSDVTEILDDIQFAMYSVKIDQSECKHALTMDTLIDSGESGYITMCDTDFSIKRERIGVSEREIDELSSIMNRELSTAPDELRLMIVQVQLGLISTKCLNTFTRPRMKYSDYNTSFMKNLVRAYSVLNKEQSNLEGFEYDDIDNIDIKNTVDLFTEYYYLLWYKEIIIGIAEFEIGREITQPEASS